MNGNFVAAIVSAVYVLAILGLGELARARGMKKTQTRKIIHVGIGTWVIPTFFLFESRWWAAAPAAGFVLFNALSHRYQWLTSMEGEERSHGTTLYPASIAILLALCWEDPWRAVGASGVLAMTWGDASASLVGRRWPGHPYAVFGHPRSLEGSFAMLGVSFAAMIISFAIFGESFGVGLLISLAFMSLIATLLEAISLRGVDNLLVPLGVALGLWILHGRWWN